MSIGRIRLFRNQTSGKRSYASKSNEEIADALNDTEQKLTRIKNHIRGHHELVNGISHRIDNFNHGKVLRLEHIALIHYLSPIFQFSSNDFIKHLYLEQEGLKIKSLNSLHDRRAKLTEELEDFSIKLTNLTSEKAALAAEQRSREVVVHSYRGTAGRGR